MPAGRVTEPPEASWPPTVTLSREVSVPRIGSETVTVITTSSVVSPSAAVTVTVTSLSPVFSSVLPSTANVA